MKPNYYFAKYKTNLDEQYNGCYIIRSYLVDKDDYGDCLKNVWKVIGETTDGQFVELKEISRKLPSYSNSQEDVDEVIKKVVDIK